MKKIYLVRHGESEFNAGGVIKPENEIALTEKGHVQAEFIAQRAIKLIPEVIISSTLLRAVQTAEHIAAATGKNLETFEVFVERRYPSINLGLTLHHPKVQEVEKLMIDRFGDENYKHSDEELFPSLRERALRALQLLEERPEETIVLVGHGIFLRVLLSVVIFGKEVTQLEMATIVRAFKTQNTGVSLFEYDSQKHYINPWTVRIWNDHAHLG